MRQTARGVLFRPAVCGHDVFLAELSEPAVQMDLLPFSNELDEVVCSELKSSSSAESKKVDLDNPARRTAPPPHGPTSFLSLPLELRRMVYAELWISRNTIKLDGTVPQVGFFKRLTSSLLHTTDLSLHIVAHESAEAYWAWNTFSIPMNGLKLQPRNPKLEPLPIDKLAPWTASKIRSQQQQWQFQWLRKLDVRINLPTEERRPERAFLVAPFQAPGESFVRTCVEALVHLKQYEALELVTLILVRTTPSLFPSIEAELSSAMSLLDYTVIRDGKLISVPVKCNVRISAELSRFWREWERAQVSQLVPYVHPLDPFADLDGDLVDTLGLDEQDQQAWQYDYWG